MRVPTDGMFAVYGIRRNKNKKRKEEKRMNILRMERERVRGKGKKRKGEERARMRERREGIPSFTRTGGWRGIGSVGVVTRAGEKKDNNSGRSRHIVAIKLYKRRNKDEKKINISKEINR